MKRFFLIDGFYCFFRAFYGVRGIATSSGFPTNAIFGFTNMLLKVLRQNRPDYLAVVFDPPGPTFRDELYADYKGTREEPDEALVVQIPYLKRVPEALNLSCVEVQGFEADDVIGTLARRGLAEGLDVVIVTGDKDMMQLVTKEVKDPRAGITMFDDMKGRNIGIGQVREKFGVPPELVADVLGLMGDSSDNIPGVRGIGPKGAAKLVGEHGSVESILRDLEKVAPNLRKKLEGQEDSARLSRKLATIRCDVPVEFRKQSFVPGAPNREKAVALFTELEFTGFLRTLDAEAEKKQVLSTENFRAVTSADDLRDFAGAAKKAEMLSVDLETDSLDPMRANIVGFALATTPGEAVYVPVGHRYLGAPSQISLEDALEILKPLLESERPEKVGQNLKYDALILRRHSIRVSPVGCDTMVAAYLVDPDKGPFNLERIAREYLGHDMITYEDVTGKGKKQITFDQVPVETAVKYAGEDADVVLRLVPLLREKIRESNLEKLWTEVEQPLLNILLEMEHHGVRVDPDRLRKLAGEFQGQMRTLRSEAHKLGGREFNLDSPKQLQEVLFGELGLKPVRRTKTGYSTDEAVLEKLTKKHPLPKVLLRYRMLSKLRGTYVEALPRLIHPDTKRIHTSYNQAVAATGRLSSSDPNLQNIPVRTEEGRRIRAAFVPEPGWKFVSADYSQIELRVMAHLSEDKAMIGAFREGHDIHQITAAQVSGVAVSEVTKDMSTAGLYRLLLRKGI